MAGGVNVQFKVGNRRKEREAAARTYINQLLAQLDGQIDPEKAKMLNEIERSVSDRGTFPMDYPTTEEQQAVGPATAEGEFPMADVPVRKPIDLRKASRKKRYLPYNRGTGQMGQQFELDEDVNVLEFGSLGRPGTPDAPSSGGSGRDPAQVKAAQNTLQQYAQAAKSGETISDEMMRLAVSAAEYLGLPTEEITTDPGSEGFLGIGKRDPTKIRVPSFKASGEAAKLTPDQQKDVERALKAVESKAVTKEEANRRLKAKYGEKFAGLIP